MPLASVQDRTIRGLLLLVLIHTHYIMQQGLRTWLNQIKFIALIRKYFVLLPPLIFAQLIQWHGQLGFLIRYVSVEYDLLSLRERNQ